MAMEEDIKVGLSVDGNDRVERGLRGVVSSTRRAQRDIQRENERTTRSEERAAEQGKRVVEEAERDKRSAIRRTEREHIASLRSRTREAERAARMQRQAENRARMQRGERFNNAAGTLGLPLGAGAAFTAGIAALTSALSSVVSNLERVTSALESQAGTQDVGERAAYAVQFQRDLESLGGEVFAGQSPEETTRSLQQVQEQILAINEATNIPPGELLGALTQLQTEFSAFEFGRRNLRALAEEAQRTGAPVANLARLAGLVQAQFGDLDQALMLNIMAQAGRQGAITPEGFAQNFAGQAPTFRGFIDAQNAMTPEQSFRVFAATANTLRQGTASDNTAAMYMQNLQSALSRQEVQQNIALATGGRYRGHETVAGRRQRRVVGGIQLRDFRNEQGVLDLAGYVEALQSSGNFGSTEAVMGAVGDQQASAALYTLIDARRKALAGSGADLRTLTNVSAEEGAMVRAGNLQRIRATASERAKTAAGAGMREGIENMSRVETGLSTMSLTERLRSDGGVVNEYIADSPTLTNLLGAASRSDYAEEIGTGLRWAGAGIGALAGGMVAGPLGAIAGGITAYGSEDSEDNPFATLANVLREQVEANRTGNEAAGIDDRQIDRLATRTGQEVARALRDNPDGSDRVAGGAPGTR